jgi:hypothetical protein
MDLLRLLRLMCRSRAQLVAENLFRRTPSAETVSWLWLSEI